MDQIDLIAQLLGKLVHLVLQRGKGRIAKIDQRLELAAGKSGRDVGRRNDLADENAGDAAGRVPRAAGTDIVRRAKRRIGQCRRDRRRLRIGQFLRGTVDQRLAASGEYRDAAVTALEILDVHIFAHLVQRDVALILELGGIDALGGETDDVGVCVDDDVELLIEIVDGGGDLAIGLGPQPLDLLG